MTTLPVVILVIGLFAFEKVKGISIVHEDVLREGLSYFIGECSKVYNVPDDQIQATKETGRVEILHPCFMRCMLTKAKIMNDEGFYDPVKSQEVISKFSKNEEYQDNIKVLLKNCTSVNSQQLSSKDEACERANLVYRCFITLKV